MAHQWSLRGVAVWLGMATAGSLLCVSGLASAQGADRFLPDPGRSWHDLICVGDETPLVGDFDGDGADDVAVFVRDTRSGDDRGGVWVSLSTRTGFGPLQKWASLLCIGAQVPVTGDFDGNGRDDVAVLLRDTEPEPQAGDVYVALSTGTGFQKATKWQESFCAGPFIPLAGDVDGDGKCDLIAFVRSAKQGSEEGDVYVALSEGNRFTKGAKWHDFMGIGDEVPIVGDFNGDRRADIGTCVMAASGAWNAGAVYVALSEGQGFGGSNQWRQYFSRGDEKVETGDANGDGRCDLIAFTRGMPDPARGAKDIGGKVFVALSDGARFSPTTPWHQLFCVGEEVPRVGDFNGDRQADIAAFVREAKGEPVRGDVLVSLASTVLAAPALLPEATAVVLPGNPEQTWRFRARQMDVALSTRHTFGGSGGEDPIFAAIAFRSRFRTPGSTRVWWCNSTLYPFTRDLRRAQPAIIPRNLGELEFDRVRILTRAEVDAGAKPEVIGVVLIALDDDIGALSDPAVKQTRMMDDQVQLWGTKVAEYVERAGDVNTQRAAEGLRSWLLQVFNGRTLVDDDPFRDDDEFVGSHLLLWVAAEQSCTQLAINPPARGSRDADLYTEGFLVPLSNLELDPSDGATVLGGGVGAYTVSWTMEQTE